MMNKTNNECETKLCQYETATRPRFYNGMLLTDQHLREEQLYHREALKRNNRLLFGSGIVCGLKVTAKQQGLCLKVDPGVALDCCGNLIEVCKCITLDLTKVCKEKYGSGCVSPDTKNPDAFKTPKYLVLRYAEYEADPEPVLTPANECKSAGDKPNCEASKVREGFCIELWDRCPCPEEDVTDKDLFDRLKDAQKDEAQKDQSSQPPSTETPVAGATQEAATPPRYRGEFLDQLPVACSPCGCCEDAVGLAKLVIDCATDTVTIEKGCRRFVVTPRTERSIWALRGRDFVPNDLTAAYLLQSDRSTANMLVAAVEFDQTGAQIKELKDSLKQPVVTVAETEADTDTKTKGASKKGKGTQTPDNPPA
jgi:hypothetical protein